MDDFKESQLSLLRHIHKGGLVAVAIHGKKTKTIEILSRPFTHHAGLMRVEQLREDGMIRDGDRSPYKSGFVTPVILTEKGKLAAESGNYD